MVSSIAIRPYLKVFDIGFWAKQIPSLNLGPEVLFVILGAVFILVWGLGLGRTRALVSLLAIYIAFVLETNFPYFSQFNRALNLKYDMEYVKIGLFFSAYIVTFAILNKSLVKARLTMKETSVIVIGLISLLQLGLLISIILNNLPVSVVAKAPVYLSPIFLGQQALFIWFFVPILYVLFIKRD